MESKIINGIRVYAPSSRKLLIDYAMEKKSILVAVNAEKILHSTESVKKIISRNVGYPDGYGALMALSANGIRDVVKIPGCELWLDIIKEHFNDKKFYLVGGKQDVIDNTVIRLKSEYQGIDIVNYRNGYFDSEQEYLDLIEDIIKTKPDVVFIAMGSPQQEILMERLSKHHQALYQGLGGSFDVYTNLVKRAPNWWVKNNIEWLYRLIQEPRRIKRQIYLVKFLFMLKIGKFNN